MALTISNCYIIKLTDYMLFDQVVSFLTENGQRHHVLALGVKKIMSKNGRNLQVGNYNQIEFFQAREHGKVGKLKKTVVINPIPWELHEYVSFNLVNEYVNKTVHISRKTFFLYQATINIILKKETKDWFLTATLLIQLLKVNGIYFNYNECNLCHKQHINALDKNLLYGYCSDCNHSSIASKFKVDPNILDMINYISKKTKNKPSYRSGIEFYFLQFLKYVVEENIGIIFNSLKKYDVSRNADSKMSKVFKFIKEKE